MALATFKCVDKTVQVNPNIFDFTLIDPDIEEVIDLTVNKIHSDDFLEIIKFYEGYNFDKAQFLDPKVYKRKIVSPNIAENLGEKNYKLISNLVFG